MNETKNKGIDPEQGDMIVSVGDWSTLKQKCTMFLPLQKIDLAA